MNRFAKELRDIEARLDLPQPAKSRILLEIAADLNDACEYLMERGLSEREAVRKAADTFDLSDAALAQLVQLHESPLRRFLSGISEQARHRWERIVLILLVLLVVAGSGGEIYSSRFFTEASPLIWLPMGAGFAALLLAITRVYALYIRQIHDPRGLRAGLSALQWLALFSLLAGACGFGAELYRVLLEFTGDVALIPLLVISWLLRAIPMAIASLVTAIGIGVTWFVLENKVERIERAEAAHLLDL